MQFAHNGYYKGSNPLGLIYYKILSKYNLYLNIIRRAIAKLLLT